MYNWSESFSVFVNRFDEKDSGRYGKAAELAVRDYLRRMAAAKRSLRVAGAGKVDGTLTFSDCGKRGRVTYEVKTNCGEVSDSYRAAFVLYAVEVNQYTDPDDLPDLFRVYAQEEWQAMLHSCPCRGSLLRVKERTNGGTVESIQSFRSESRPKASKPLRDYLDACAECQPTLTEWEALYRGEDYGE